MNQNLKISHLAKTSFITFYCHAIESQSKYPILNDPKAVEITDELNSILSNSKYRLDHLANGKLKKKLVTHIDIRARQYDRYINYFLKRSPGGVVVNIGCLQEMIQKHPVITSEKRLQ